MTPYERLLLRAVMRLVIDWRTDEERDTLLGLVAEALPKARRSGPVEPILIAAQDMLSAKTSGQWVAARHDATKAVDRILTRDLCAAIESLSAERMNVAVPA